jgi:aryl-alcohol dehydrogenase-like predicted oxidoreductase
LIDLRNMGVAGIQVSALGIGTNTFGNPLNARAAARIVDVALELGINFFDTADIYGDGESERQLGAALKGRREKAVIASKFGFLTYPDHPNWRGGSRRHVRNACEHSLRRLGTDYIDLYQMHAPDLDVPIEETLEALTGLVQEGKIRAFGNSQFDGAQIIEADRTSRARGWSRFVSAQNRYNVLDRAVEQDVIPACRSCELWLIAFQPLAQGLLSGKYSRAGHPPKGARLSDEQLARQLLTADNYDRLERLEGLAAAFGTTVLALSLARLLAQSVVLTVITGATSPSQVRENAEALALRPSSAAISAIDRIVGL